MFHELGVHTIDGGPTLNPSTYDLLAGDPRRARPRRSCVLPNSANVIMAAEHAARLSDKQVLVAPTTSQQAGLAAAVALAPERSVEENAQALDARRSRGCAPARSRRPPATTRRAASARRGGRLRRRGGASPGASRCATLQAVLDALAGPREDGEAPGADQRARRRGDADRARRARDGMLDGEIELELRHGGQPAYWWLLAAE